MLAFFRRAVENCGALTLVFFMGLLPLGVAGHEVPCRRSHGKRSF
jgi:hypothetical protein